MATWCSLSFAVARGAVMHSLAYTPVASTILEVEKARLQTQRDDSTTKRHTELQVSLKAPGAGKVKIVAGAGERSPSSQRIATLFEIGGSAAFCCRTLVSETPAERSSVLPALAQLAGRWASEDLVGGCVQSLLSLGPCHACTCYALRPRHASTSKLRGGCVLEVSS